MTDSSNSSIPPDKFGRLSPPPNGARRHNWGFALAVLVILLGGAAVTAWQRPDLLAVLRQYASFPIFFGQKTPSDTTQNLVDDNNTGELTKSDSGKRQRNAVPDAVMQGKIENLEARLVVMEKAFSVIAEKKGENMAEISQQLSTRMDSLTNLVNRLAKDLTKDRARPADDAPTRAATLAILVAELSIQVDRGLPFAETLDLIRILRGAPSQTNAIPDQAIAILAPMAEQGAPRRIGLILEFPTIARAAKENFMMAGQHGFWRNVMRVLSHLVVVRRIDSTSGESIDAVLASAHNALNHDDLEAAVEVLRHLPPSAEPAFADWSARAKKYYRGRECRDQPDPLYGQPV